MRTPRGLAPSLHEVFHLAFVPAPAAPAIFRCRAASLGATESIHPIVDLGCPLQRLIAFRPWSRALAPRNGRAGCRPWHSAAFLMNVTSATLGTVVPDAEIGPTPRRSTFGSTTISPAPPAQTFRIHQMPVGRKPLDGRILMHRRTRCGSFRPARIVIGRTAVGRTWVFLCAGHHYPGALGGLLAGRCRAAQSKGLRPDAAMPPRESEHAKPGRRPRVRGYTTRSFEFCSTVAQTIQILTDRTMMEATRRASGATMKKLLLASSTLICAGSALAADPPRIIKAQSRRRWRILTVSFVGGCWRRMESNRWSEPWPAGNFPIRPPATSTWRVMPVCGGVQAGCDYQFAGTG